MRIPTVVAVVVVAGCAASTEDVSSISQATTVCGGGATVHGMDVSGYETSIDFPTAKAAGIEFAFIRASDGSDYIDPSFDGYWAAAREAGVMRGAYQSFRPEQDPIAQADLLLAKIAGDPAGPGDLPPVIDVEVTDGLTPEQVATSVQAWVAHVGAAIGRSPIIYAGFYSWASDTGGLDLSGSPLWHAEYSDDPCPNIPVPWTQWTFWQYTASGTVPSVEGELTDLDVFDGTLAQLQTFAASGAPPCGTIASSGGVIDDGDPCFAAGGPAATLRAVNDAGEGSGLIWTHTTDATAIGNFARWDLDFAAAGSDRVEVYTDTAYAQATRAAYVVHAGSAAPATVVIDQRAVDGWQTLGVFDFAAGGDQWILLGDDTGDAGQQLVFDAVRVTPIADAGDGSDGDGSAGDGSDGVGGDGGPRMDAGCAASGGGAGATAVLVLAGLFSASRARRGLRRRAHPRPRTATRRRAADCTPAASRRPGRTARRRARRSSARTSRAWRRPRRSR